MLFLQTYYLRLGGGVVLKGALLGLILSGFVAVLTFVLQQRLPYRQMLVTTGVLLGAVLLVMVGEQAPGNAARALDFAPRRFPA